MLKTIRKNKKSVLGVVGACFIAFLMLGFGMSSGGGGGQRSELNTVIKVDGQEISHRAYTQKFNEIAEISSKQFGAKFNDIRPFLNLEQRTIDTIINDVLLDKFTSEMGLDAGKHLIAKKISELDYFKTAGLTAESYDMFVKNLRLTRSTFEGLIRKQVITEQLNNLLVDFSLPTEQELRAIYVDQNTEVKLKYMTLSATDYTSKVDTSDEEKLKQFFSQNYDNYQQPKTVRYSFVKFAPEDFLSKVDVNEEDLSDVYARRKNEFIEPAETKFNQIVINKVEKESSLEKILPASGDKDKKAESKIDPNQAKLELAKAALERLKKGEDFSKVSQEASELKNDSANNKNSSWQKLNDLDPAVKNALEDLSAGSFSEVVETDKSYLILRLEEMKEKRQKPMEEVRPELEKTVRSAFAPEYAKVEADNFLSAWESNPLDLKLTLEEYAKKSNLPVQTSGKLLPANEEPEGANIGLTAKAIQMNQGERQVVDVGGISYLLQIDEVKDAFTPDFAVVRDAVIKDYKETESKTLAKIAAENLLKELKGEGSVEASPNSEVKAVAASAKSKTLEEVAKAHKLEIKTSAPATKSAPAKDEIFNLPNALRVAFSLSPQNPLPEKILDGSDKFYLIELSSRTAPEDKEFVGKKKELLEAEKKKIQNRLGSSFLQVLKAKADIWVDPKLLEKRFEEFTS